MNANTQDIDDVINRRLSDEELKELLEQRDDLPPKLRAMERRRATLEVSHAACHRCGRRFALRFVMEARERIEQAMVFRINMRCQQCAWNGVFFAYVHQDGRCRLDPERLPLHLAFTALGQ